MALLAVTPQRSEIRFYDMKLNEVFTLGACVLLDGSQEIVEAGANPAAILGFAACPNLVEPYPTKTPVWLASSEEARFWITGSTNGTTVVAPTKANLGVSYDIAGANGIWYLKTDATGNARLFVHAIDLEQSRFLVSILAANRQLAP